MADLSKISDSDTENAKGVYLSTFCSNQQSVEIMVHSKNLLF